MDNVWFVASLWVGLTLIATLLGIWLRISTALSEIVVGTVAQLIIGVVIGHDALAGRSEWVSFLAGVGATVYRGIEGYGASSRIHRKRLLTSSDLPVMVCIIDTAAKIEAFLPTVERMVGEGLIAISDVEVIRYAPRREPASGA
jgi:Uncharacterized ACR, COG1993